MKSKLIKTRKLNDKESQYTTQLYKEDGTFSMEELTQLIGQIKTQGLKTKKIIYYDVN
jgi:hypothetical protein